MQWLKQSKLQYKPYQSRHDVLICTPLKGSQAPSLLSLMQVLCFRSNGKNPNQHTQYINWKSVQNLFILRMTDVKLFVITKCLIFNARHKYPCEKHPQTKLAVIQTAYQPQYTVQQNDYTAHWLKPLAITVEQFSGNSAARAETANV